MLVCMGAWAEDYSTGYYTISPGANTSFQGFYSASNANSKYGGSSSKGTSLVYFTFEKTDQENVYYWYDCSNRKYIYADDSGYLQVADSKATDDNNYKWFIKDDGNGNLTITDMTNYNNGSPTKGLIQLSTVGGWWASKCTLSSNSGRNTWKFNLLMKKNTPYYIGLQRAATRYLQYSSNKMQQAEPATKGVDHIWYFTDGETGSTNIYALPNITAMGYASDASGGADKIATTNAVKDFYIKSTNSTDYPFAFLTKIGDYTYYISNNGGVSYSNMGLHNDINDSGTRLKVEDATAFFAENQTVNLVPSNIITPYSGGAGTSDAHVSINHTGGSITLTGAEKTYYLGGSNSATQTTVNFDGTTVDYSNELGIGAAIYNINNTSITTPKFITSQGGNNRAAVVNLTGDTKITVTGNSNVDTNQSSIMIGHWNGSSNVTLSNTAQIEAVDAQLLIGKTSNTQTITLNGSSNITAMGIKASANATGTNTINLNGGSLNLGEVGITSYASTSISVNVTENSTITATAETLPISQPITVASGKTLTIDGDNNSVTLTGSITNNGTIAFKDATVTANIDDRSLSNYTFTDCTATLQFTETGTEYAAGGFTITNVPAGVTVKVKKYGTTEYETVTPEDGTATISHSVGVSGSAAWLDYTFNLSTIEANTHSPADRNVNNAGNAGVEGNSLTLDTNYDTANSYNTDGTLKVMSTPYRGITWPTNYTVAVAGNVPDVENGCLVAFGTHSDGYLAILRGDANNKILLVKGKGANPFEVISTMTAANATELSHLVVFTKNGNTFTVYLDGVQKTQVTYSETLGGGLQIGSIHGGVTSTGIVRVSAMSDATAKAKVFAKAIRVYDYVISAGQMETLKEEFPYVSFGGEYSRIISSNSNLSATDAWLNKGTQGYVDVPVNAVVEEVTYYPDVKITTTAASTLTVNTDMDVDNITFDGTAKLTIASDGTHNIQVYGSVTANGPVSFKYGETDLSAVGLTIGESGSVEFDFSDYDFSAVATPTDYPVTGYTADYGSKVTCVSPSDIYHSYTLTYSNTTNSYYLTVAPTVAYKQQQAIALATPYYNGNQVGTGLGKYTVSLGETSYLNFQDFGTAVMGWQSLEDCVEPTITLNTPAAGFYRLKNVATDQYLNAVSGPYNYTQSIRGVYANGSNSSAATVIELRESGGNLYMYNQGSGFGWVVADGGYSSGRVGYLTSNPDKYVNWFPGTAAGQIAFAICIGNGTGDYASYLKKGIYAVDTADNAVVGGTDETADVAQWVVEAATTVTIPLSTIGDYAYATTCLPFDVTITSGANAYVMTESGEWLVPTQLTDNKVPAGTPVLLRGTSGTASATATINTGDAFATAEGNVLSGTYLAKDFALTDGATAEYFLGKKDGVLGFYHSGIASKEGYYTLGANKAYFAATTSARGYAIMWDESETTGIENIDSNLSQDKGGKAVYDLQGRKVANPSRGLYIINGKKVVIK